MISFYVFVEISIRKKLPLDFIFLTKILDVLQKKRCDDIFTVLTSEINHKST